ncbi:hypothetical protein AAG570_004941 [Ranatra chinensis]|uniref:Rapamycin-insensitive companion of mTOR N-terminal domain-containing protein n=1 Tax=Ranatra chinensis TaxID=642074 RepID=A0ABD0XZA8_9HEMI
MIDHVEYTFSYRNSLFIFKYINCYCINFKYILICRFPPSHSLRPLSFHESTHLKNASFRAVRYFLKTEEHVDIFIKLKYDFLIARRVLAVCPGKFTYAPVQAMVSLTHPSHTDILQAVALAFLAEIGKNKAGINLHCLTATAYMDRNLNTNNMNESSGRWCTTVLVSLLRSWTGILHLCQGKRRAINSVINCLYVSHLQKPMLEALYELLQLVQPEWTDEMSVALAAVDPSRWQNSFRLSEGFLTAETSALFPHLAKSRVNLVEVHLAIILYCFLEANLLDAIIHVIVSNDTFLSVRATILLGE